MEKSDKRVKRVDWAAEQGSREDLPPFMAVKDLIWVIFFIPIPYRLGGAKFKFQQTIRSTNGQIA